MSQTLDPRALIWVTWRNQDWASEVTGYSTEEIKEMYQFARLNKIICSIHGKAWTGEKTVFERAYSQHLLEKAST